jgi:hypothetical protein
VGEWGFNGFDVAGAEEFSGEDFRGVGAGFPGVDDFGGGEGAGEDGHAVALAQGDDVGAEGGGDDKFRAREDAGARGLGVEDRTEAEEKIGEFGGSFLEHADGARGGHGELDAGEATFGEGFSTVE